MTAPLYELAHAITGRLDGPHSDDDTAGAACTAAEAVRFLNYATGHHATEGLTYPATAYLVIGNLEITAARLSQLLGQLTDWLDRELAAGRLGEDSGADPALAVERARRHLETAAAAAGMAERALAAAQSATASLNGCGPKRGA